MDRIDNYSYCYMRLASILFISLLVISCSDESLPLVHYSLPENVRFIKLQPTLQTHSRTIVANGMNKIQFRIALLDKNQNELFFISKDDITVLINDKTELKEPFIFSTSQAGEYRFTVKDANPIAELSPPTIKAVAPPDIKEIVFPIIFHVATNTKDTSWVRDYTLELRDSLVKLNESFANQKKSSDPNAMSANIRFELAELDPKNVPLSHKGLHVIYSEERNFDNYPNIEKIQELIMSDNFWSPKKYINVWVLPIYTPFAFWPLVENNLEELPDSPQGVVISSLNTSTLTHELGHAFGLYHVFSQFCIDADLCNDTWSYARVEENSFERLQISKKNCEGDYFVSNNYMDYPYCEYNTFTLQQVKRMRKIIQDFPFFPLPNKSRGGRKSLGEMERFEGQKVIH